MYTVPETIPPLGEPLALPKLDAYARFVKPAELPVVSDQELLDQAERTGEWDMLERYGYGAEATITLTALYHRFEYVDMQGRQYDEVMSTPGRFVNALWATERQVPNAAEYARALGEDGLLEQYEVAAIIQKQDSDANSGDKDVTDRAKRKFEYLINLQAGAIPSNADPVKLASKYATAAGKLHDEKARLTADQLLLQARGLSGNEIDELFSKGASSYDASRYRAMGMPADIAVQIASYRPGRLLRPESNVQGMTSSALDRASVDTQLAVRQFFGFQNTYDLLDYQARMDKHFGDESAAERARRPAIEQMIIRGDKAEINQENARRAAQDAAMPDTIFDYPFYSEPERERFKSLSAVAVREPALRTIAAYFVQNTVLGHYRRWMDDTIAAEAQQYAS